MAVTWRLRCRSIKNNQRENSIDARSDSGTPLAGISKRNRQRHGLTLHLPIFSDLRIHGRGDLHAPTEGMNFWLILFAVQAICSVVALMRERSMGSSNGIVEAIKK